MSTDNGFEDILIRAERNIYSVKLYQLFTDSSLSKDFKHNFLVIIQIALNFMLLNFNFMHVYFLFLFCISENTSLTTEKHAEI